jgi:integrase
MEPEKKAQEKDDILQDSSVSNWLAGMQNATSRSQYGLYVKLFFTWLRGKNPEYKTPSEFIAAADADLRKPMTERRNLARQRIVEFYEDLCTNVDRKDQSHKVVGKGLSYNSAKTRVAAVRSLLNEYGIVIKLERRHQLMRRSRDPFKRMRLTLDQVKAILSHARLPRDRAIIIALTQGGMDQDTLCSMKLKDVKGALAEGTEFPWQLDLLRGKAGVEYFTFLTEEGANAIKIYLSDLRQRGIILKDDDPLWLSDKGKIPMTPHNIQAMLRVISIKAGLANGEDRYNVAGGHALREFLSTTLEAHGMPRSYIDAILGHTLDSMTRAYFEANPAAIKEKYKAAYEYIALTSSALGNGTLRAKIDEQLNLKTEGLINRLKDTEDRLKTCEGRVGDLEDAMRKALEELKK